MSEKVSYPKSKVTTTTDGTVIHSWDGKFHNLEGPAVIPQGDKKKAQYYIFGKEYTKDQFKKMKKEQTGIPWVKKAGSSGQRITK
jgi:hypothetical protein